MFLASRGIVAAVRHLPKKSLKARGDSVKHRSSGATTVSEPDHAEEPAAEPSPPDSSRNVPPADHCWSGSTFLGVVDQPGPCC
ncbi:hypothetical protein D9M68_600650 [compost metagenome]